MITLICVAIHVRRRELARYVTAVLLSVRVDVRRGAATLHTTLNGTTPSSSMSTTSTTRDLRCATRREGIIYDHLYASDPILRSIYFCASE
jgi:hypothetical protein